MLSTGIETCVIFGCNGYYRVMFNGINDIPGMQYCVNELSRQLENSRTLSFLHRILNSSYVYSILRKNNKKRIRELWMGKEFNKKKIISNRILFLFLQNNSLSHSGEFISFIKRKYPEGKTVFWITNTLEGHKEDIAFLRNNYDCILTFSKKDALEHGFTYHDWCYRAIPQDTHYDSDLFFCGWDKGRTQLINQIYDTLSLKGIKCDFTILTQEESIDKREGIKYVNAYVPYEEVMKGMMKARCLLEVMPVGNDPAPTLRRAEAIALSKKLLTNNVNNEYAMSDSQMRCFRKAEEIDPIWIKDESDENFIEPSSIAPEAFLTDIINAVF